MIVSGQTITPDMRDAWLAERRNGIGASEAASALGLCDYRSPLKLYLEKVGLAPPEPEDEAIGPRLIGRLQEPVVLELYRRHLGGSCEIALFAQQRFVRSELYPWMTATLDAVRDDGRHVELKSVGWRMADRWGEPGTDEVPDHYHCQVLHQLAVTGEPEADLAVLIGGQDFRVFTIRRDPELVGRVVAREEAFWDRVQRKIPPEPTQPGDARLMAVLHPGVEGACELDAVAALDAHNYFGMGQQIRHLEEQRERIKAQVLAAMGPAAHAIVPGLGLLKRRVVKVDATFERKGFSYVDLRLSRKGGEDGQA